MSTVDGYFRAWRFDRRTGTLEGLWPLDPLALPVEHCRFVPDEDGRLGRLELYKIAEANPAVKIFGYDPEAPDRIAEALDYDPDGSPRLIHRYHYDDEAGWMTLREEFDGQGTPRGWVESVWTPEGLEVEERIFTSEGAVRNVHRYSHDERGRVIREEILGPDLLPEGTREIAYDDRDNVVGKGWRDASGTLRTRYEHDYDEADRVVATRLFGGDGQLRQATRFLYDEVGNPMGEAPIPAGS